MQPLATVPTDLTNAIRPRAGRRFPLGDIYNMLPIDRVYSCVGAIKPATVVENDEPSDGSGSVVTEIRSRDFQINSRDFGTNTDLECSIRLMPTALSRDVVQAIDVVLSDPTVERVVIINGPSLSVECKDYVISCKLWCAVRIERK